MGKEGGVCESVQARETEVTGELGERKRWEREREKAGTPTRLERRVFFRLPRPS